MGIWKVGYNIRIRYESEAALEEFAKRDRVFSYTQLLGTLGLAATSAGVRMSSRIRVALIGFAPANSCEFSTLEFLSK